MQGTLLAAAISPSNTPHAYNLTFLFPEIMFVVVAAALYLRFRNRHLALLAGRRPYGPSAGAAGSATAVAEASPAKSDTTSGSTLHDGGASESSAQATTEQETTVQQTTVQQTTVQQTTVQPTTTAEPATEDGE